MLAKTETDGPKTTVTVIADEGSRTAPFQITGVGVARCRPDDLYVAATGELIALGRAMADYSRQIEALGLESSVSNADVVRVGAAIIARDVEQHGVSDETLEAVMALAALG